MTAKKVVAYRAFYNVESGQIGKDVAFLFDHRSKQSLVEVAKELLLQANLENLSTILSATKVRVSICETDFGNADSKQLCFFEDKHV